MLMIKYFNQRRFVRALTMLLMMALMLTILTSSVWAGGVCFSGYTKGSYRDSRGWHHYVEFRVDRNGAGWTASGPMWPSVWGYSGDKRVRAGYSWPYNWASPWPASSWKVCR